MKTTGNLLFAIALVAGGFAMGWTCPGNHGRGADGVKLTQEQEVGRWFAKQLTSELAPVLKEAGDAKDDRNADSVIHAKSPVAFGKWLQIFAEELSTRTKDGEHATELLKEWAVGMEHAL